MRNCSLALVLVGSMAYTVDVRDPEMGEFHCDDGKHCIEGYRAG